MSSQIPQIIQNFINQINQDSNNIQVYLLQLIQQLGTSQESLTERQIQEVKGLLQQLRQIAGVPEQQPQPSASLTQEQQPPSQNYTSIADVKATFTDGSIKTLEDIRRVCTPEAMRIILIETLKAIDFKIGQGKSLTTKDGSIVEARGLAVVVGLGAQGPLYQFPACVVENKIIPPNDVAAMRIDNYLEKYLGYDIRKDKDRIEDLKKYTNLLY